MKTFSKRRSQFKDNNGDSLSSDCEESSKLIPFPLALDGLRKSSTVSFNIDDENVEIELTGNRSSNGSIFSSSSSLNDELSDTYTEFQKTIKCVGFLVILIFIMSAFWIAYLWWDHVNNHHQHGEADRIMSWNRKIFHFVRNPI